MPKQLVILLIVAGLLLIAWSLVVPIFEGSDEPAHWGYAHYLHERRRLPVYSPAYPEANSPPLYYLLAAPLAVTSALPPRSASASGAMRFPPRFYLNTWGDFARYWPIRLVRLLSVALSVVTVLCCFLAGREVTGRVTTGLLAGSVAAFLPQFTFRGMNVSNDVLVTTCAALTTYLLIRLIRRGFVWPVALAAALALAGALLSKINAAFLVLPVALALVATPAPWSVRLRRLAPLGLTAVLVTPWLLRNQRLYGDLLAQGVMTTAIPDQIARKSLFSSYFIRIFPFRLVKSFIGHFGWLSLPLPSWLYVVYIVLLVAAVFGLVCLLRSRAANPRLLLILVAIPVLNLLTVIYINLTLTQPQGRFMFPALAAIATLVALGLEALPCWSGRFSTYTAVGLAVLNAAILGAIVLPAYWPPP